MRILFALLAAAGYCLGAAYPPSGSKPKGPILVYPSNYGPPEPTTTTTTEKPRGDNYESPDELNARIMEQLRQQQGSERGVYHVYLEDGRLQRVQYTRAPLSSAQQKQQKVNTAPYSERYRKQQQQESGYLASVQYSPVEPIQGPVYTYSPSSLTRILRYAPDFY